jgi:signal transduction histidine kinase
VLDLCAAAATVMDRDGNLIVGTRNFTFDLETLDDYPGGRIGEFARITVRDNGRGLTEEEFERILDPGASARPALAAAGIAVEKIGGFVRVESAEGVGTAVHLYFARATDADTALHDLSKPAAEVAE